MHTYDRTRYMRILYLDVRGRKWIGRYTKNERKVYFSHYRKDIRKIMRSASSNEGKIVIKKQNAKTGI